MVSELASAADYGAAQVGGRCHKFALNGAGVQRRIYVPYTQGHWKTWHASQDGRNRLHFILRFRHDLQFIDSRGSLLSRRVGSRSIPT
jgi:hypothetical protein